MKNFKTLKPVQFATSLSFPQNPKNPYVLIYMSENSTFLQDYHKLNLRRVDAKIVVVPITKIPRTVLSGELIQAYKNIGLLPYSSKLRVPQGKNVIFDLSQYTYLLDAKYKFANYRRRGGMFLNNILEQAISKFPNYNKVLIYSIDLTKNVKSFISRKSFPILQQLKSEEFNFDSLVLATILENKTRYRVLMKDKEYDFTRVIMFMRNIKEVGSPEEEDRNIEDTANTIVKKVSDKIDPKNKETVKTTISKYLVKNKEALEKIMSNDEVTDDEATQITTSSLLYNITGDIKKSDNISKSIPLENKDKALKAIDKNFSDEIIKPLPTKLTTNDEVVEKYDIVNSIDKKSPEHLFQKRQLDFEINLKKDMENSFKVLERKDVPLKISKMEIVPKQAKKSELNESDVSIVKVMLTDDFKNKHKIEIEIPKIDPETGTFRVYGEKKCLINQIVQNPITFLKPYDSKFESSYSAFHITSKRRPTGNHLEIYLGSNKLPLLVLLSFSFGFEEVLKSYGITYKIVNQKSKEKYPVGIGSGKYILFENVDTEIKKELCNSVAMTKVFTKYKVDKEFGTKDYFNDLIINMTGRVSSTYQIQTNLENIVDPVVRQVLINKQLPYTLPEIIKYMASKVVDGFTQKRNDLSNQRIKGSEVLVHLAQKQILAAYTEYKEQVLSGNKEAKFDIPSKKLISEFIQLELVSNMEYANPIEELSTLSRVTPVGKAVGGIPTKEAIQVAARNVHPSYFGNIDPVDTPEGGESIGINQQLTIDAFITSARGIIHTKDISDKEGSGILSTSTCTIPFIENTESARIMLAGSQIKQIVPLKNPEPPIVQSGYESILTNVISDSFIKRAKCDGKVTSVTKDSINILCKNGSKQKTDITPSHLKSGSGKNTLSVFKPTVKVGDVVKSRDIIAEGACISKGSIALGRTLLTCTMAYKGFNFEDGIVISDRLVNNNKLTSLHGIEEEVLVSVNDRIVSIIEIGSSTKKGEPLLRKTIGEIEQLIGFDEEDESEDITGGQYIKKSPGGVVVDIEIFSNIKDNKFPKLRELIEKTRNKYGVSQSEKFTVRGETINGILIKFKIEQELTIGLGDKLCNRYGNKGIVSLVEKEENMPRAPWGEPVDIITNPLGISNRMIVGQLYEMYCGLISKTLAKNMVSMNSQEKSLQLLKRTLPKLDMTKNKQLTTGFLQNFSRMRPINFKDMIDQMKENMFFPIVIPPFKAPGQSEIASCLRELGLKPGYKVYLPEFGVKTYHEVPVGYMYFNKLEHIGEMKLHARSTGPIQSKTGQPLAGKRREGGQRMGESETFILTGNNCPMLLSEFMGPLSDDQVTKNEIISEVVENGTANFRPPKATPTKDLLNSYFISLMLEEN